ncbi:MAG: gamma-glutamyltransferase family protein [Terriglobales bacterium]
MNISIRIAVALLLASSMSARDRSNARSMVVTRYGIVATSHVQASVAGAQILERGGSAVDAAIAANAVLGVTEPMMNGMGGDLFAIYWDAKTGKLYGLNASGWAPRGLTIEHLKAKGATSMPLAGIDSVTVPGAVAGWHALHERFGRVKWKDLFQSAIFYAEDGYPVPEIIASYWNDSVDWITKDPEGRRVYLPNGKPPALGQVFQNHDLAIALRLVAQNGAGISTTYRDWTVYELPPNGQGMAALEMLNIMETSPASPDGPLSVAELHKKLEAMKLAYADLGRYNADPRFAKIPVKGMLSKEYARQRARLIDPGKANCEVAAGAPPTSDTTYLSVVDREGNVVSLIQSNYESFGSGIVVRGMGFVLQDRGALFSLDPASPNALAPRKRPFHTIIPAFMEHGEQHVGFGIMGGANQPLAHAQFVSNVVDYGMNIQEALENARFTVSPQRGCNIVIESRVAPEVRQKLSAMGHQLDVRNEYSTAMGRGQAVMHDSKTNVNYGASDARADGSAVPESPPMR